MTRPSMERFNASRNFADARTPRQPGVRSLEQPRSVQLAADALRDVILAGELKPGQRLVEERLTQQLGISRPPLREAMRLLQREGLVRLIPRRGAIVSPLTQSDVWEIQT